MRHQMELESSYAKRKSDIHPSKHRQKKKEHVQFHMTYFLAIEEQLKPKYILNRVSGKSHIR